MPWLVSADFSTAPGSGSLKLGQPVPLSNFFFDGEQRLVAARAQEGALPLFDVAARSYPGISVPCARMI